MNSEPPRTIKAHRQQVMEKMEVRSVPELVSVVERFGFLGSTSDSRERDGLTTSKRTAAIAPRQKCSLGRKKLIELIRAILMPCGISDVNLPTFFYEPLGFLNTDQ